MTGYVVSREVREEREWKENLQVAAIWDYLELEDLLLQKEQGWKEIQDNAIMNQEHQDHVLLEGARGSPDQYAEKDATKDQLKTVSQRS